MGPEPWEGARKGGGLVLDAVMREADDEGGSHPVGFDM